MSLDIIYRWKCDECGATVVTSQGDYTDETDGLIGAHIEIGHTFQRHHMPRGWNVIDDRMICPLHTISIHPLQDHDTVALARDIYNGNYGYVPDPLPDDLKSKQMRTTT